MSNKEHKQSNKQPATWREYMRKDWFAGFMAEVQRSSITAVSVKLGLERTTISQVFNGSGEYGKGKASTGSIEHAYHAQYEKLTCPHTQAHVGIAHCREVALRAAPTHNPLHMQQWQACQQCKYKPREMAVAVPEIVKPIHKIGKVGPVDNEIYSPVSCLTEPTTQQAGVIDTVTLPLPEVGAPQISTGETA